ncbi:MAG TPA: metal-dependent transcriptional regulator [Anaerolineae bacterium]|nr:metal-dependent transcriptional regulator [Anaerolineae bacterium]
MISQQMEEYLEAIGKLQERGQPVTTSALARECGVAAPTVTEMLHRLAGQGLIDYTPRREIALTEAGRSLSSTVIRRHRLWERFLHDVLGLGWDRVHDEACQLEHATSPDLERRLARALGNAATCPHGHAIPAADTGAASTATSLLSDLTPPASARIVSVSEEAPLLRRLAALKLRPGAVVQVTANSPDEGTVTLSTAGVQHTLAHGEAARIAVAPLSAAEERAEQALPLAELAPGATARICGFRAGRGLVGRCLALGFTPGAEVRMVQNAGQGPVIVIVRETRVALGRGEAGRILVSREGEDHAEAG